jgi:hypothetical protein
VAVSRAQIFYEIVGLGKWSNVYHQEADSLIDARIAWTTAGIPILLGLLHSSAQITRVLVSSLTDDTFTEAAVNESGTSAFSDSRLPLFNSVKALFQTAGLGRPDLKFYKGWLTEALNDSGFITSPDLDDFETALASLIGDMSAEGAQLCSENGDAWGAASVQSAIQMRQMHRKRRHVTP